MFCKYCGKQIDDDSKFCKECGKNLSSDIHNNTNVSISSIKPYFIPISIFVIWYALTFVFIFGVFDYAYEYESPIGMLALLWITPIVYYLAYSLINKYSKYPIRLWSDTDKPKTKLFKSAYLIYSFWAPLACSEKNVDTYIPLMFVCWLIPSMLIYLLYIYKLSKKGKKNHQN